MKIAVISDTHDNLATLDKFLVYIKKNPVESIIHCGDIAEGQTLERLALGFDGPPLKEARLARTGGPPLMKARLARTGGQILAVLGNMDYRDSVETAAKKYPGQIQLFKNFGQAEISGLKLGFCHFPEMAKRACQKQNFDFVFYGHTHKPWRETVNNCQLANPGNLAGMFYKASFAVLDGDTKNLELKIVERL